MLNKRFAASVVAGCMITAGVVAPSANAVSVKVSGGTCHFTFTAKEQERFMMPSSDTTTPQEAKKAIKETKAAQAQERKAIAELKKTDPAAAAEREKLFKVGVEAYEKTFLPAFQKCAGSGSSNAPQKPKPKPKPNPKPKPGTPGTDGGSSSQDGGKPGDAEGKNALSDEDGKLNGAGIGVVSAGVILLVLGGVAAALPSLKPMLPAEIAAMLP